jgi:ribonucleoside-diphosphate reductase alpha chain
MVRKVLKRDGSIVPFNKEKIVDAVEKGMNAAEEGSREEAELVAGRVYADLVRITKRYKNFVPSVEGIQDTVEKELILNDYVKTAKAYILYREEHAQARGKQIRVAPETKALFDSSKNYFRNQLGEFLFYRSYARWIPEESRRETWIETVDRYVDFMKENLGDKLTAKEYNEVREAILKQEVMPSMRLMQFAGEPARRTNVCAYNCSYIAPESFRDFAEVMYISMCGTGCGWSAESRNIQKLPQINMQTGNKLPTHVIPDDKEGWCDALLLGMKTWAKGDDIDFDYSQLRPAGARLKTMGGKSSGPEPLRRLLNFTREKMLARQGRRLRNIDAHDILCMIGNCVVSGGVRRSAMISLSDLDDTEIRDAKKGQFWNTEPQRSLANNSAVYERKPSAEEFLEEWTALMKSGSGERGIFNRGSLATQLPERRLGQFDGEKPQWGTNPCGEIILQSKQFCNLSEVIAREDDDEKSLLRKARLAAIIGTYQSTLTHFPYLSKKWKENCEQERLLGVSITGQWDCVAVRNADTLRKLKNETIKVNKKYAEKFGVNQSTGITCVKPSGTVSKTFDTAAGMHPRHAKYYLQRIRISATDSLFKLLKDQKITFYPEVGQSMENATTYVLEFPMKSPDGAIFKDDLSAIEQLEYWKVVKENYTEHNPSATISVGEDEWIEVANWLYKNWEIIGGLSFLPRSEYVYELAPYEEIDEKRYKELAATVPEIDFSQLIAYEIQDETDRKQELACVAGNCEVE